MNDEQVNGVIEEMERALMAEDPALADRVRGAQRSEAVHFVTVFVLLAAGAVLLTVGLAMNAFVPWSIGVVALITAVLIDDHHQRTLR